jgi:DNA-binding transcriptional LysR family regulator
MLNRVEMLRIFCAAAESDTFREAATRLGTSPQSVTRAIKELESTLGEMLFHRSTRQIHITAFGEDLARQARETLSGFDQLFTRHTGIDNDGLAGRVGITAPHAIGRLFLLEFLKPLMSQHPELRIDLRFDDEMTDAVEAQVDIGIRVGYIRDRRYIARAAGTVPLHVVAAPQMLASTGVPLTLEELKQRPLSVLIDRKTGRPWPWMFAEGQTFMPQSAAFTCDDPEAEREIVLAGLAYAQMPTYLAEPHLREGRLVEVVPQIAPPPWELFVYRPQRGPVAPRVRLVYDHLLASFSDPLRFPQGVG